MTRDVEARRIGAMLRHEVGAESVDYLSDVLASVARTRQRRPWELPGRWLSVDLAGIRGWASPALTPLLLGLVVLGMLLAGLLVAGQRRAAPPFGLAGDGVIAIAIDGRVVLLAADGTSRRVLDLPVTAPWMPVFSPDGTRMAFWSQPTAGGPLDLHVADADGSGAVRVNVDLAIDPDTPWQPSWSPDGQQLVFPSGDRLYLVRADGSGVRPLVPGGALAALTPRWSPDGTWIAFQAQLTRGRRVLAIVHPDGSGYRELPTSEGSGAAFQQPAWASDGRRIVYMFGSDGMHDIAVIDVMTDVETVLSDDGDDEFWPVWSPDDRRVMWNTALQTIRLVDPDGAHQVELPGLGIAGAPFWAPDGQSIAGVDPSDGVLVIARPDGTGDPLRIPLGGRIEGEFDWQRVPVSGL
jgi:dipeptidyl aminopeptidase/acylaminoacyl peptidase